MAPGCIKKSKECSSDEATWGPWNENGGVKLIYCCGHKKSLSKIEQKQLHRKGAKQCEWLDVDGKRCENEATKTDGSKKVCETHSLALDVSLGEIHNGRLIHKCLERINGSLCGTIATRYGGANNWRCETHGQWFTRLDFFCDELIRDTKTGFLLPLCTGIKTFGWYGEELGACKTHKGPGHITKSRQLCKRGCIDKDHMRLPATFGRWRLDFCDECLKTMKEKYADVLATNLSCGHRLEPYDFDLDPAYSPLKTIDINGITYGVSMCKVCFSILRKLPLKEYLLYIHFKEKARQDSSFEAIIYQKMVHRYRLDFYILTKTAHIIMEGDENEHSGYDASEEIKRMTEIGKALQAEEQRRVVFVRFNFDSFKITDRDVKEKDKYYALEDRFRILDDIIRLYFTFIPEYPITVLKLFYDNFDFNKMPEEQDISGDFVDIATASGLIPRDAQWQTVLNLAKP